MRATLLLHLKKANPKMHIHFLPTVLHIMGMFLPQALFLELAECPILLALSTLISYIFSWPSVPLSYKFQPSFPTYSLTLALILVVLHISLFYVHRLLEDLALSLL
ncbi:hypothetical protein VNO77_19808 [Canavalia gladiata]|uniref:Uncharacterized protein n=1 Tax=Canavalia gladiata TaxID=3824 RepID=A0AAN9LS84_CANGL